MSNFVRSVSKVASVSDSSSVVLFGNNRRRNVAICNTSYSDVYISKDPDAEIANGILLTALGGTYIDERDFDGAIYTGVYSAIAVTAGSNYLAISEDSFEN